MSKVIQLILLVLFAAVCGAAVFYFLGGARSQVIDDQVNSAMRSLPKTESEFRDRLAEFRMERQKVLNTIKGLKREKGETLKHLKAKGINSSADLKDQDPDVDFALRTLQRLAGNIKEREADVKVYDEAIAGLDAQLDDLRRKHINDSGMISKDEYMDLQKHIIDLRERLQGEEPDLFEEEKLRDLLDLEMGNTDTN